MKTKSMGESKRAISYIRFSTSAQGAEGKDSKLRQEKAIVTALKKHGLELDQEFHDWGRSAYHKRHIASGGALFELRRLAVDGKLKSKVLVIENWDRAGRLQATDAAPLVMDLINNGVDLVVGSDGGDYFSKDNINANLFLLYRALDEMNRGFGESQRKSEMAKSKWQSRREAISNGEFKPLGTLPFWLVNGKDKYEFKAGMKKLIKDIFELYLSGHGAQTTANILNERKVPLPLNKNGSVRSNANGWHSNFIQRLVRDRALIGYYFKTDHKIFPPAISENLFYQANQKRKERTVFPGRKADHVNPYSGLTFCAKCGSHIGRHTSRTKYSYLQCSGSRRAKCSASGIPYNLFEESVSVIWENKKMVKALVGGTPNQTSQLTALQGKLGVIASRLKQVQSDYITSPSTPLANIMAKMEADETKVKKELENATIAEKGTMPPADAVREMLSILYDEDKQSPETRLKIQECLRNMIERITIDILGKSYAIQFKGSKDKIQVTDLTPYGCKVNGQEYRLLKSITK